jgi:hypothetical protein
VSAPSRGWNIPPGRSARAPHRIDRAHGLLVKIEHRHENIKGIEESMNSLVARYRIFVGPDAISPVLHYDGVNFRISL